MKTIITIAIATLAIFGASPKADARPGHSSRVFVSGYLPCGTPIYKERFFVGYDHCGKPIWKTRVVRQQYRPVSRPRYVASCPPPHRGRGTRIVVQGSFYR